MHCKKFDYTRHAVEQMFSRAISTDEVETVIGQGEEVAAYPDDRPYPSYLVLYYINQRPIHVVVTVNSRTKTCIIITAYEPTTEVWKTDFKTRKK